MYLSQPVNTKTRIFSSYHLPDFSWPGFFFQDQNEPDLLRNRWNISHYVTGTIFIEHKKCTSNDFGHLSWLLSFPVKFLDVGCFYLFLSILLFQWMFSWSGAEPHDSNLCLVKSDFLSHLPGLFHSVCNPSGWLCGDGMVCPL